MKSDFDEIYKESINNPEKFWQEISNDIFWFKKPSKILNKSKKVINVIENINFIQETKFKNKKRVLTPKGKHAKELKKVYKNKKDANDYMAAIMISKGG